MEKHTIELNEHQWSMVRNSMARAHNNEVRRIRRKQKEGKIKRGEISSSIATTTSYKEIIELIENTVPSTKPQLKQKERL
jgi:hypothetical protein